MRSPRASIRAATTWAPAFLNAQNLSPYIDDQALQYSTPIRYRTLVGTLTQGYDAKLLPAVCLVYGRAREHNALTVSRFDLPSARYVTQCNITTLVDMSSGFELPRARRELIKVLAPHIPPELLPWSTRFPAEFFAQVYRLANWPHQPVADKWAKHVGRWINSYIYEQLPPDALNNHCEPNLVTRERSYRSPSHDRFLSVETGNPHLDSQIALVTILMRVSKTEAEFELLFAHSCGVTSPQRRPPC